MSEATRGEWLSVREAAERRRWTSDEDAILANDYRSKGGPEMARILGRSLCSIYGRVESMGLHHQPRTDTSEPMFRERIRRMHADGLSDAQIAIRIGCERHTVAGHRRSMGLRSNRLHPRQRARVAAKTREQCEAAGVASLAEVRAVAFRRYATESGWPADLAPREVHILEAMLTRGPMTRREIADAIGMAWLGSRPSLKANNPGGSYLASLMRRGLVVDLGRLVRNGGSGRNSHLYTLAITTQKGEVDG